MTQQWTLFLSKIKADIGVWLRTAHQHIPGSRPLERFGVITNRSANQTSHAGVAYSGPARPSDWNVARFSQFKQAPELRIPRGGDSTTRKRHRGARSGRSLWQVRSVINPRHAGGN